MSIYIGNNKYKEIYLGSNKISEVYLGSSKVYASLVPSTEWVNLGSTEYSKANSIWASTSHYALTGMPTASSFNYCTYIFDAYLASGTGGADIYLENSSNTMIWCMRTYTSQSYPGFVSIQNNVLGWSTASGAPYVNSFTIDGVSYRYCSSKFSKGTYARFKIAFDRPNKRGYVYIGGTLLGTATLKVDPITISKFGLSNEKGNSNEIAKMKNIKVAGFTTLAAAQAWS